MLSKTYLCVHRYVKVYLLPDHTKASKTLSTREAITDRGGGSKAICSKCKRLTDLVGVGFPERFLSIILYLREGLKNMSLLVVLYKFYKSKHILINIYLAGRQEKDSSEEAQLVSSF